MHKLLSLEYERGSAGGVRVCMCVFERERDALSLKQERGSAGGSIRALLGTASIFCKVVVLIFRAARQVVTDYTDAQLPLVLELLKSQEEHLTAAIVSKDLTFQRKILSQVPSPL